jgi:hypothetical protein
MKVQIQMPKSIEPLSNKHIYFIIICIGIILFGKSIFYEYTHMDDAILLVMNQAFIGDIANMPKLFTTDVFITATNSQIFYRPLLNLLFMLEAQVAKDNPLLYHITNILLHIGCSILVYTLFQKMQFSKMLSALSALIFCVHPLQTSAVVWIPGRNDTLLTLFILSSWQCLCSPYILVLFSDVSKRIRLCTTIPMYRLCLFCAREKTSTGRFDLIEQCVHICHCNLVYAAKYGVPRL